MKYIILLNLIIFATIGLAQDSKIRKIDLYNPEITLSEIIGQPYFSRELLHSEVDYQGNEEYFVFGPNGNTNIQFICHGDCLQQDDELGISFPTGILGANDGGEKFTHPIYFKVIDSISLGEYEVKVTRNGKTVHIRKFRIVADEPVVNTFKVTYPNGDELENSLIVDKSRSLKSTTIQLEGNHLDQDFDAVSIQGFTLKKIPNLNSTYKIDGQFNQDSLLLGDQNIIFKRKFTNNITKVPFKISAVKPNIRGVGLEFPVEQGKDNFNLILGVQNVFRGAQLELIPHGSYPNFLEDKGKIRSTVNSKNGVISAQVWFKREEINSIAKFKVRVINTDGNKSQFKTITVRLKATSIAVQPLIDTKPLIAGIPTQMLFKRVGGANLNLEDSTSFTLKLIGLPNELELHPNKISDDSFTAILTLPEGVPSNMKFILSKGKNTWNGEFSDIYKLPVISILKNTVKKGTNTSILHIQHASEVKVLLKEEDDFIKLSTEEIDTDKKVEIKTELELIKSDFTVLVKLKDHIVKEIPFVIDNWLNPSDTSFYYYTKKSTPVTETRNILVFEKQEPITIKLPVNNKDNIERFSAQLLKEDGTKLGNPIPLVLTEKKDSIMATLSPKSLGINYGEKFNIEMTNPVGDAKIQSAYIKRTTRDMFILTAGLSAMDLPLTNRDSVVTQTLDGVNIGAYYMLENIANPNNRVLGMGFNTLLIERDGSIKLRGGVSFLFFEKIVLGLSFGKDYTGMMIGVNIELADLSKLFVNTR
ncbi:MAG: hypothetical protein OEW67_05985 [Cyclobacteriaceae bacterium]|nr:hypothetical protein [Cyclobacteriaceae bacterium]